MAISKAEKRALAAERREKRRQAAAEVMESRLRTGIGFAAAYVGTQILPNFAPTLAQNQTTLDLAMMVGGGWLALSDDSELGDYALGVAMVGATQTLDTAVDKIQAWLNS